MIVFVMERVPASLRGELTRWMLEARAGVFIGDVTAMVRDKLWEKACAAAKGGSVLLVHSADTEQGFAIRSYGEPDRTLVDYEGLLLFRRPAREQPARAGSSPAEPVAGVAPDPAAS